MSEITPVTLLHLSDEVLVNSIVTLQMFAPAADPRGNHGQSQPDVAAEASGSPWGALHVPLLHLHGSALRPLC